ncbi:ACP phosphodiesterase [Celerinatantimonas sp. YJH-8]|uniref:acyl carrier protein phosphodiesterase n=1 Tax=Celerinatantimonas sp. YJH-8 TaxID=3228714 RepID=UPI0038C81DEE
MNYLGHFYLANLTHSSYCGALLGDFIKGRQWQHFPRSLQVGILYHRKLDQWIDHYSLQLQLTELFSPEIRRFAPIGLDLFWDYCLANQWTTWHPQALSEFSLQVYQQLSTHQLPDNAQIISQKMRDFDWLQFYQHDVFIERALRFIAKRLKKPDELSQLGQEIWQCQEQLNAAFPQIMQQLFKQLPDWKNAVANQILFPLSNSANDTFFQPHLKR